MKKASSKPCRGDVWVQEEDARDMTNPENGCPTKLSSPEDPSESVEESACSSGYKLSSSTMASTAV